MSKIVVEKENFHGVNGRYDCIMVDGDDRDEALSQDLFSCTVC